MSAALPSPSSCGATCPSVPASVQVPGPPGVSPPPAVDGIDGINAFTRTTAAFVMPAELATVTVSVLSSAWAAVNQIVFVSAGAGVLGYFQVTAIPSATSITLKNLKNTTALSYMVNSAPATNFASTSAISPAGIQGQSGTAQFMGGAGAPGANVPPDPASRAIWRDETNLVTYYWNPGTAAWV